MGESVGTVCADGAGALTTGFVCGSLRQDRRPSRRALPVRVTRARHAATVASAAFRAPLATDSPVLRPRPTPAPTQTGPRMTHNQPGNEGRTLFRVIEEDWLTKR